MTYFCSPSWKGFAGRCFSFWLALMLPAILLMGALTGSAQDLAGKGALRGTVLDASGSAVAGASVVVKNDAIGLSRSVTASVDGVWEVVSLPPAEGYSLTITSPGFATFSTKGIAVHVGSIVSVNASLKISSAAETVQVEATSDVIDVTRSGVSDLVGQQEINDLPINGRRVDQFVLLTPGVTTDGSSGSVTFRGVPGNNLFLQDGIDVTQQWGQDNAGSTSAFSPLSQDAVQEFQVQTSNYSAEFGHAAGGVVNTLTKSGTNNFHGSAFEFFKNRTLNSTDPYSTLNDKSYNPSNWRHQAGGSVGGPIIKDKLFIFGNTEETRESRPLVSSYKDNHLTSAGAFVDGACTGTQTSDGLTVTAAQCDVAQKYIQRIFTTVARKMNENVGFIKLDYRPNDRDSFTANFNLMQFASPNGAVSGAALADGSGYYQNGNQIDMTRWSRLSYTRVVSNNAINEFRFGWYKDTRKQSLSSDLLPSNGMRSGLIVGSMQNLGVSVNIPNAQPSEDRFMFTDNYSLSYGKHQLKFGAESNYMRDVENALFFAHGRFTYATIANWVEDMTPQAGDTLAGKHYLGFLQAFDANGSIITRAIVRDYNGYVQDHWQINRKLTVDLGMRYEFSRFTQPPTNKAYPETGQLNEPKGDFAPRVGFAYELSNKVTLRGGYGISYARLPSASVIRLQQRNGVIQKTIWFDPTKTSEAPVFPGYLLNTSISGSGSNVTFADPNLATPYTEQADFTLETKLDSKSTLSAAYLWNTAVKFLTRKDDNLATPTTSYTYKILDANGKQTGMYTTPEYTAKKNDSIGVLNHIYNGGRVYYNGLAVSYNRQQSKNMQFTLGYNWSHTIDNGLGAGADNIYYTDPPLTVLNGDQNNERGNSPLDQRQRLVASGLFSMPNHDWSMKTMRELANGWQLSVIETAASSQGVDPQNIVAGQPFSTSDTNSNTISGIGIGFASSQRVPFMSRSSLRLGDTIRTDARLTKTFNLPAHQSIALNFEAFNALNYSTVTSVVTAATTSYADGTIKLAAKGTNGVGSGTASAGFPDGTNARRAQVSARWTF